MRPTHLARRRWSWRCSAGRLACWAGTGCCGAEATAALLWLGVYYLGLSYFGAKTDRYAAPAALPLVSLSCVAVLAASRVLRRIAARKTARVAVAAAAMSLIGFSAWRAQWLQVPEVRGYHELVAFVEQIAPGESILYDGSGNTIFTSLLLARDRCWCRRVLRGDKILYETASRDELLDYSRFLTTPDEIIDALRNKSGCRLLLLEYGEKIVQSESARILRDVVAGPGFERVRSFPITWMHGVWPEHGRLQRIDIYRQLGSVKPVDVIEMPFPNLGKGVRMEVRPLPSRCPCSGPDRGMTHE